MSCWLVSSARFPAVSVGHLAGPCRRAIAAAPHPAAGRCRTITRMHEVVERAESVVEVIEAHADEASELRRLPAPVVAALVDASLMRMCVPSAYGGPDTEPSAMLEAIMTVARADGAAGWCSMIASTTSSMAAFLPPESAMSIYGDPKVVTGGVFAPNGVGAATTHGGVNGFDVTGRWAWGSGTQHCEWVLGGTRCDDGTFRLIWFPQADVTFHDTWHTGGMRGSGSLGYSVDGVFAPAAFSMQPGVTPPQVDTALARFPNFSLLAVSVSAVGLGVARRSLDEIHDIAQGKKPQFSAKTLAEAPFTQIEFSRAEGRLRAARCFLLEEVAAAWAEVERTGAASVEQRTRMRLAAVHAASESAAVADIAFTLAGGTAVYDSSVLGRCSRDAHVVTQYIQTAPKLHEKVGRLLLGQHVDITMW